MYIMLVVLLLSQVQCLCCRHKCVRTTTSNIGVSIISLHDTPRLHTLKRVIRIFFIPRTYNESNKLTLGYIHQNPTRNTKVALLLSNATVIFKISLQNLQNMAAVI